VPPHSIVRLSMAAASWTFASVVARRSRLSSAISRSRFNSARILSVTARLSAGRSMPLILPDDRLVVPAVAQSREQWER